MDIKLLKQNHLLFDVISKLTADRAKKPLSGWMTNPDSGFSALSAVLSLSASNSR